MHGSAVPLSDRPNVLSAKAPATIAVQFRVFIGGPVEKFKHLFGG
jgi:hypothetical protein